MDKIFITFDPREPKYTLIAEPGKWKRLFGNKEGMYFLIFESMLEELTCQGFEVKRLPLKFFEKNWQAFANGDMSALEERIRDSYTVVHSTPALTCILEDCAGYHLYNSSVKSAEDLMQAALRGFNTHSSIDYLIEQVSAGRDALKAVCNIQEFLALNFAEMTTGLYSKDSESLSIANKDYAIELAKKMKIPVPLTLYPSELINSSHHLSDFVMKPIDRENFGIRRIKSAEHLSRKKKYIAQEKVIQPNDFKRWVSGSWVTLYTAWNKEDGGRVFAALFSAWLSKTGERIDIPLRGEYTPRITDRSILKRNPYEHLVRQTGHADKELLNDLFKYHNIHDYRLPGEVYDMARKLSSQTRGLASHDFVKGTCPLQSSTEKYFYVGDTTPGACWERGMCALFKEKISHESMIHVLGAIAADEIARGRKIAEKRKYQE